METKSEIGQIGAISGGLRGSMSTFTKIKCQLLLYYVTYERSFNIYVMKII
jgi:hypothetical protein